MIDQLRRKKFLERLRSPSSVPSVEDEMVAETIQSPVMNLEGDYREDPLINEADSVLRLPRVNRERERTDNATSDMMVGASHALIGLLSGNKNRMAMEMGKGNKYVSERAKEDKVTAKDLVKVNIDGKPIYTPVAEAVDQEAYQAPARTASGLQGSAKDNTAYNVYEPSTGNSYGVIFNSREGKYYDNSNKPIVLPSDAIVRPFANKLQKTEDIQGNITIDAYNQHAKNPVRPIKTVEGLGAYYGVQTKGQAEQIEKGIGEGQKEAQAITGSMADAAAATETIRNSSDPRAISAAIYSLTRSVEPKGVLTEQDFQVISGNSFMPTLDQIQQYIQKKGTGNLEDIKKSYLGLGKDIQRRLEARLKTVPSRFAPGSKRGQQAINAVIPKAKQMTKKNQAEWIQVKRAAETRWGPKGLNQPDRLNSFLEMEKQRLGIE